MEKTSETLVNGLLFPEGLRWHDNKLYFSDMNDSKVISVDLSGKVETIIQMPGPCSGLGWTPDGQLLIVSMHDRFLMSWDGNKKIVADNLKFPNGTVITPDHQTLIVAETYGACLTAFDIKDDGTFENKKTWAHLDGAVPDGICLDEQDGIWVASPISSEVLRVLNGGEVTDRIKVQNPAYACMLGGSQRKTLFVATSGNTMRSGRIESFEVKIPGAGLP